jgi:AcrR family transcriptional regulator
MAIIDREGHRDLTMRALARECGMTAPGIMHYFPNIATLVTAVVEYRDTRDAVSYAGFELAPGLARRILDSVVDNIVARPKAAELFAMVQAQAIDPGHPGHEYFKERAQLIADQFVPILALEYSQPEELIGQVVSIVDGLQLNWLRDPDSFDLRDRWDAIADPLFAAAPPSPVPWEEGASVVEQLMLQMRSEAQEAATPIAT